MNLDDAQRILAVAVLAFAVWAAVGRGAHWPVAGLVGLFVVQQPALIALRDRVILPAQAAVRAAGGDPLVVPLAGWDRAGFHLYQALFIAWGPAVAILAALAFGWRLGAKLAAVLWAGSVAVLSLCYYDLRGDAAKSVYLLVAIVSVGLAIRSLVHWAKLRRSVESHHAAALVCIVAEVVGLLVHKLGLFGAAWDFARAANVLAFLGLLLIEGASLWSNTSTSSR